MTDSQSAFIWIVSGGFGLIGLICWTPMEKFFQKLLGLSTRNHGCHIMTLRDYFAAKALEGGPPFIRGVQCNTFDEVAEHCYRMADAMLEARKS